MRRTTTLALLGAMLVALPGGACAEIEAVPPDAAALIDPALVADMRLFIDAEIVRASVAAQGLTRELDAAAIAALDATWTAERKAAEKPLIAATLSAPLSTYLTRVQARSLGLITEIIVVDRHGLNVGQSAITSDYYQGDEDKYRKTFLVGPAAVFVDEAEYDDDSATWRAQLNLTVVDDGGSPIGAATFEINLTELARRKAS